MNKNKMNSKNNSYSDKKTKTTNNLFTPKNKSKIDYQSEFNFKSEFRKLQPTNYENSEIKNITNQQLTIHTTYDSRVKKEFNINSSCDFLICKNYPKIQQLKKFIVELSEEINSLNLTNQSLKQKLQSKEDYISDFLKFNDTTFREFKNKSKSLNKFNPTTSPNFSSNQIYKIYDINGRLIDTSKFMQENLYDSKESLEFLDNFSANKNTTSKKNYQKNYENMNISDKNIKIISDSILPKISKAENQSNTNENKNKKDKKINEIKEDTENNSINSNKNNHIIKKNTFNNTKFIYKLVTNALEAGKISLNEQDICPKDVPKFSPSRRNDSLSKFSPSRENDSILNLSPKRDVRKFNTLKIDNQKININSSKQIVKLHESSSHLITNSGSRNSVNLDKSKQKEEKSNIQQQINLPQVYSKYINNQDSHYNRILRLFNRLEKTSKIGNSRMSYLGLSDNILNRMLKSDLISQLGKVTINDEEFMLSMRTLTDDKLLMVSDLISTLISDYQYSLQLIRRIKTFMDISVRLVHSKNSNESIQKIISNCKEVLSSEYCKIFIYTKKKNLLINQFESFQTNIEEKESVQINEGIVGNVFSNNQRQKIDDASKDNRFSMLSKKSKNDIKIKTVLCSPIRDEEGTPIGVIQAINKKGGIFTNDDEELIEIFAKQIFSTHTSNFDVDESNSHIFHLQNLLEFSLVIPKKENILEFVKTCENSLKNIWNVNQTRIYFVDNLKNNNAEMITYFKDEEIYKNKAIGIIGKCLRKREVIPEINIHESLDYNSLIDIEGSLCLVTFPIIEINSNVDVVMIMQMEFNSNYLYFGKLKKNHLDIILGFSNQLAFWYSKNKINLDDYNEVIANREKESEKNEENENENESFY